MRIRDKAKEIKGGWAPVRLCECCGRFIVLLKLPGFGSKTDQRWYITCYFKSWDGNPWFMGAARGGGNAQPHPTKAWSRMKRAEQGPVAPTAPVDPVFSLD